MQPFWVMANRTGAQIIHKACQGPPWQENSYILIPLDLSKSTQPSFLPLGHSSHAFPHNPGDSCHVLPRTIGTSSKTAWEPEDLKLSSYPARMQSPHRGQSQTLKAVLWWRQGGSYLTWSQIEGSHKILLFYNLQETSVHMEFLASLKYVTCGWEVKSSRASNA